MLQGLPRYFSRPLVPTGLPLQSLRTCTCKEGVRGKKGGGGVWEAIHMIVNFLHLYWFVSQCHLTNVFILALNFGLILPVKHILICSSLIIHMWHPYLKWVTWYLAPSKPWCRSHRTKQIKISIKQNFKNKDLNEQRSNKSTRQAEWQMSWHSGSKQSTQSYTKA